MRAPHVDRRALAPLARVVVVDGEAVRREMLLLMMESLGAREVRPAADAFEALSALRREPADLVILDADIGPFDGLSLVRMLRNTANLPGAGVPILVLADEPSAVLVRAAGAAGASAIMAKPVSHRSLRACLSALGLGVRDEPAAEPLPFHRPGEGGRRLRPAWA